MLFPIINFSPMKWEQEAPVLNLCKNSLFILPPLYISFTMNKNGTPGEKLSNDNQARRSPAA